MSTERIATLKRGRGDAGYGQNIGTQSVQELFFCDSIRRTVYSNDLVKFFWLRCTARKKLGIYVHTMIV